MTESSISLGLKQSTSCAGKFYGCTRHGTRNDERNMIRGMKRCAKWLTRLGCRRSNLCLGQLATGKNLCKPSSKRVHFPNQKGIKQRKKRDGLHLSYAWSKIQ